jgi:hypothetical protein
MIYLIINLSNIFLKKHLILLGQTFVSQHRVEYICMRDDNVSNEKKKRRDSEKSAPKHIMPSESDYHFHVL